MLFQFEPGFLEVNFNGESRAGAGAQGVQGVCWQRWSRGVTQNIVCPGLPVVRAVVSSGAAAGREKAAADRQMDGCMSAVPLPCREMCCSLGPARPSALAAGHFWEGSWGRWLLRALPAGLGPCVPVFCLGCLLVHV